MIFPLSTGSSPALSASLDALCHGRFPKPTCFVFEFPLHRLPSDLVLTFLLLFVCRAISFFVFFHYFKETSRFSVSRSFEQSCRATNREKKKLPREKWTCKKKKCIFSVSPPPTWDAVRSQSGYSCHEMQQRSEARPSPCKAQPSSGRRAQRERALCRGSMKVLEEKNQQ